METKRCPECGKTKKTEQFWKAKNRSDGLCAYCIECARKQAQTRRDKAKEEGVLNDRQKHQRLLRMEVLSHYCGSRPKCDCCGEDNFEFLAIDHVGGGGNRHRQEVRSEEMPRWLKNNGYPPHFRILCHNCNFSIGVLGYCPHQKSEGHSSYEVIAALNNDVRPLEKKEVIREAAWELAEKGIYPSETALMESTGYSRTTIETYRKKLRGEENWPSIKRRCFTWNGSRKHPPEEKAI